MIQIENLKFQKFLERDQIQARIAELAEVIEADYKGNPEITRDNPAILLPVLNGSFRFTADLVQHITFPNLIDFIKLQSYSGTESTGETKELIGLKHSVEGKHVIIVEDIVDTGNTIHDLLELLKELKPASIKICTLLFKPGNYLYDYPLDYIGFEIADEYVIGYAFDFNGQYRELNDIYQKTSD